MILSAKYGFVDPDFVIADDYNVSFKRKSSCPIPSTQLAEQVKTLRLDRFRTIIGLGGRDYRLAIEAAFTQTECELVFPFAGLPVGKMMQATNAAIDLGKPY